MNKSREPPVMLTGGLPARHHTRRLRPLPSAVLHLVLSPWNRSAPAFPKKTFRSRSAWIQAGRLEIGMITPKPHGSPGSAKPGPAGQDERPRGRLPLLAPREMTGAQTALCDWQCATMITKAECMHLQGVTRDGRLLARSTRRAAAKCLDVLCDPFSTSSRFRRLASDGRARTTATPQPANPGSVSLVHQTQLHGNA